MPYTATLRKVGGSVMLALPPAFLESTSLAAGRQVAVSMEGDRLVIEPQKRPRHTLSELLAQCDADAPMSDEEREWLESGRTGQEIL